MKLFSFYVCLLFAAPFITIFNTQLAYAEDDLDDDTVDIEQEATDEVLESALNSEPDDDVLGSGLIGKSPNAHTNILFIKPKVGLIGGSGNGELHSGKIVEFLIGFVNGGDSGFTLESLDASFRYPMDYSFHIQNFTSINYNSKLIRPKEQQTLSYSFFVDESFAGRPFGLSVNMGYRDMDGKSYLDAVYNETVSVIEFEEGLDGETFFLYIFLAALIVLGLVLGQHLLTSFSKKSNVRKGAAGVERGTSQSDDVDFEWIPREIQRDFNRNASPKQSPRQKKVSKKAN